MSRLQTTACTPSYKFTGYERDSETGLDYAFARYYSPRLARFLSTDPVPGHVGSLQSHNAYVYVANNPLGLTDPSGMDYCDGNSPYTSGGGGTSNLPPPCQIAPGVYDASYSGPPPNPSPYGCIAGAGWCPGGPNGVQWVEPNPDELEVAYARYSGAMDELFWDNYWSAQLDKNKHTADCIAKGLTKHFGATVTMGASTGEVGGHWNFGVQLSFSSYDSALIFTASYNTSAANGWPPPARFFDGPALHLENLGSWNNSNGVYSINGTAHIDLYNPDSGAGGVAGHVAVDGLWGHVVQAFGGDIDPSTCPF